MTAQQRLDYLLANVQVRNPAGWTVKRILGQSGLPSGGGVPLIGSGGLVY